MLRRTCPVLALSALVACDPESPLPFASGGENTIFTQGGNGNKDDDSNTDTTADAGDPDGPTLAVSEVVMEDNPQMGESIKFVLTVSDPQDDIDGGKLFLDLSEDGGEPDPFDLDISGDTAEFGQTDVVAYIDGTLVFGLAGISLDKTYAYDLWAKDGAGHEGGHLKGDVPPYSE